MLISWLRFGETPLADIYLERAVKALTSLAASLPAHAKPAEPTEILDIMSMLASTIQVELPEEDGLMAYISLLQELPAFVVKEAALEVLRTHTYRTLPLPGELLQSRPAMAWKQERLWLEKICRWHIADLQKRIDRLPKT